MSARIRSINSSGDKILGSETAEEALAGLKKRR